VCFSFVWIVALRFTYKDGDKFRINNQKFLKKTSKQGNNEVDWANLVEKGFFIYISNQFFQFKHEFLLFFVPFHHYHRFFSFLLSQGLLDLLQTKHSRWCPIQSFNFVTG